MTFLKDLRILPRWVIASLDAIILFQSAILAYLLRFNFELDLLVENNAIAGSFLFMTIGVCFMLFTRSYKGIVRHTGPKDSAIVFKTILFHFLFMLGFSKGFGSFLSEGFLMPISVIVISSLASLFFLVLYRLLVKELFLYLKSGFETKEFKHAVIFGASEMGLSTLAAVQRDKKSKISIIAFLDDDPKKEGKILEGKKIFRGLENLAEMVKDQNVSELIIAEEEINLSRKKEIIECCLKHGIHVSIVPPVNQWMRHGLKTEIIRDIKIEDLLGREQITLDNYNINEEIKGKVVLVTGAAGSIGSELCRQILFYNPALLVMVDFAESALHDLDVDIKAGSPIIRHMAILADIREYGTMKSIFKKFSPEIVFHAAAYKHVPMIENYPAEAVKGNIMGTKNIADLSVIHHVEKFVLVSTDKAVNPTNVMGATKRAAEMYVQSLNMFLERNHGKKHTKFITTRFGNVLGSNGSVVPLFKKQIMNGGPLTVTHPEVTRYFMTIPEACQLVLEAGAMGNGGEIYVFDMGEPIKIKDLAINMIRLSGKRFDQDIQIVYTGLREGEKLYEELLNDSEEVKITHHPKIQIAKVLPVHYYSIEAKIDYFEELVRKGSENDLVFHLKSIVPEFKSNVSRFEVLDRLN